MASSLSIVTPTVDIGQEIPGQGFGIANLTLKRTADLPAITAQKALDIVFLKGISWAKGGEHKGRTVKIKATFGLATLGSPGPNGSWLGPQFVNVEKCTSFGNCANTGEKLERIQNRPVWVLEYSNLDPTDFPPPPAPCLTEIKCQLHNSVDVVVDILTESVLYSWGYASTGP